MRSVLLAAAVILLTAWAPSAAAQHIPAPDYLTYMPLEYKRIVSQTPASERFQLFGDREAAGYVDEAPKDGVDDARGALLHALGVRFAPYLVPNTTNVPMDFKRFWDQTGSFPLFVDTFNIALQRPSVVGRQSIDLPNITRAPCADPATATGPQDDCALLRLLREFDPIEPANARAGGGPIGIDKDEFKVIYFDFPGEDPASWNREFQDLFTGFLPRRYDEFVKIYMHPFVHTVQNQTEGVLGYELVLQYWFFYPTNDGGNNHEGDWEHINVSVAPRSRVTELLDEATLRAILDLDAGEVGSMADPLVARWADIYFHQKVMTFDYTRPNVYLPHDEWEEQMRSIPEERRNQRAIWRELRHRAYWDDAETILNTHTIAYIGADNKGLDQLLSPPGGTNRDSHGTYPFPGMYKDIGPAGATEQIGAPAFDHRKWFEEGQQRNQVFGRGHVVSFDEPELIELVPDWERVRDLVYSDVEMRREWSWMVLPLRWGWPAVESNFAGVVSHAETGNLAPVGPMYQGSWNRPGTAPGFAAYSPHKLPSLFPLGWQDNFVNSWGWLNITGPTLITLPPFDFIWRIGSAPVRYAIGSPDPVYYPQDEIPSRFVGVAPVYSVTKIAENFNALWLNEAQLAEVNAYIAELDPDDLTSQFDVPITTVQEDQQDVALWFGFFLGNRLVSENMFRHGRSELGFNVPIITRPGQPIALRGELNMWEWSSSLRYNLSTGGFKPYVRGGWGWSWYRIEKGTLDGNPMENPNSPWVRKPRFSLSWLLPDTFSLGAGVEFDLVSSLAKPPKGIDISLRGDWVMYFHNVGLEATANPSLNPEVAVFLLEEGDRVTRHQFNFMLTLGF